MLCNLRICLLFPTAKIQTKIKTHKQTAKKLSLPGTRIDSLHARRFPRASVSDCQKRCVILWRLLHDKDIATKLVSALSETEEGKGVLDTIRELLRDLIRGLKRLAMDKDAANVERLEKAISKEFKMTRDAAVEDAQNTAGKRFSRRGNKKTSLKTKAVTETATGLSAISSDARAKIQNALDVTKDVYEKRQNRTRGFITDISRDLGLTFDGASHYGTFVDAEGKKVELRISNHNASAQTFDERGKTEGISIVISRFGNKKIKNADNSNVHLVEFFYPKWKIESSNGKPLVDLIESLKEFVATGVFEDKSGIGERQEINGRKKFSLRDGVTYFSGGGLVEAGLSGVVDPKAAVEYERKAAGVYRNNFGDHIVVADVRDIDPKELVKDIDGEVGYFHASPVCKNFSSAKTNGEETPIDMATAKSTATFINEVQPRVVTIENVKGYRGSEAMKTITDALDRNGYKWDAHVYNAADFGGYTNRERLIVRAVREGELPPVPQPTGRPKGGWMDVVEDIIDTLPEKKNGVAPWMDERLKKEGIDYREIDKPLYVFGQGNPDGKVSHAFADELLPTLRTKSGDVIVMPDGRVLKATGRVLARISGLPDSYQLPEQESLAHSVIGNGVPTQLTKGVIAPLVNQVVEAQGEAKQFSLRNSATRMSKVKDADGNLTPSERALRDTIVSHLRKIGLEVITDFEEGQRVLDMVNSGVRLHAKLDNLAKAANTIKNWLEKGTRGKSFTIELPEATLRMIRRAMGRDFDSHNITANGVAHAQRNHGENGQKLNSNSIPLRQEDMALIPYIMTAPDYVRRGSEDASGRTSVRFYKELSNGYVVVAEKEYKNSPDDMETITMWAEMSSSEATNARRNAPDTHVRNAILSTEDAAKIRQDAKNAIAKDEKIQAHRVFHGSGADFETIDHSHMGEGEGAQAYGWGTYVTEVEGIGRTYAGIGVLKSPSSEFSYKDIALYDLLSDSKNLEQRTAHEILQLIRRGFDFDSAIKESLYQKEIRIAAYKQEADNAKSENDKSHYERWISTLNTQKEILSTLKEEDFHYPKDSRHLYTIEIPDDNGSNYLSYTGVPSVEQLERIGKQLEAEGWKREFVTEDSKHLHRYARKGDSIVLNERAKGSDIYAEISEALGSDKAASQLLSKAGVVGIKYPAQYLSGGRADGAKNYVIFNEKDAKIVDHVRFFRTEDGKAYGYTVGGKIYLDPRIASSETPIHEYGHLWITMLQHEDPKAWKEIVKGMKATPVWEEVKRQYPELETDEEIADEAFAHFSGARGAERLRQLQSEIAKGEGSVFDKAAKISALQRFKDLLKRFWNYVAGKFRDGKHRVSRMNEFADKMMSDLAKGINPTEVATDGRVRKQFIGEKGADNSDMGNSGVSYSLRKKPAPKKTEKVYKLMRLGEDGKLYPLFIDSAAPTELGKWYDADSPNLEGLRKLPSGVHLIDNATGEVTSYEDFYGDHKDLFYNGKLTKYPSADAVRWATDNGARFVYIEDTAGAQRRFNGESRRYWNLGIKGGGSVGTFSMRPGWHAGTLPTMRQIGKGAKKDLRDDRFVWVEGEVSADVDYNAEAQRNPDNDMPDRIPVDGYYLKSTNGNPKAAQADRVGWYVAGSFKANRIISDSEVRAVIDEWNAAHPDKQVEYDYERESGKEFNAETMSLEDKPETKYLVRNKNNISTINKQFDAEIDLQKQGKLSEDHTYALGNPSEILKSTGIPQLPIQLKARKLLEKATKYDHDFDLEDIKGLVNAIQAPLAIFAYGNKSKAQNLIVSLQKDGKNFIVGLSLNPIVGGRALEINSVRNVFPKDNAEWLNWIQQGKQLYLDKEKIQVLLEQQRTNLADVPYLDLDSIAKIVEEFENPPLPTENSDGNTSPESPTTKKVSLRGTGTTKYSVRDRAIVRDEYERMIASGAYQFQETVQDSMLSLKKLMQLIVGKDTHIEDVPGYENAYLAENRMSSVNVAEHKIGENVRIQRKAVQVM